MKRLYYILFLASLSLFLTSCNVSMDKQLKNISSFIEEDSEFSSIYEKASTVSEEERIEYYTYVLSSKLNVENLWTQDYYLSDTLNANDSSVVDVPLQNLIAETTGESDLRQFIIISAPLDDPASCVAAIESFKTLKDANVRKNNSIRLILYNPNDGLLTYKTTSRQRNESNLANFQLANMGNPFNHLLINERRDIFIQLGEIVFDYMGNDISLELDEVDDYELSPRYMFVTDEDGLSSFENAKKNTEILTSMICILN